MSKLFAALLIMLEFPT